MKLEDFEDFVTQGCSTPGCGHKDHQKMFFHPRCHPDAQIEASFGFGDDCVLIACLKCHKPIVHVHIASKGRVPV